MQRVGGAQGRLVGEPPPAGADPHVVDELGVARGGRGRREEHQEAAPSACSSFLALVWPCCDRYSILSEMG
eukprot:2313956-Prymnesium_polylepis.1